MIESLKMPENKDYLKRFLSPVCGRNLFWKGNFVFDETLGVVQYAKT